MKGINLRDETGRQSGENSVPKYEGGMMIKVQIGQLIVAFATLIVQLETLIKP